MKPYHCKSCGTKHGMVLQDRQNGSSIPLDLCYGCLFLGKYIPVNEKIHLEECGDQTISDQLKSMINY